jgi:NADH-quinone oxidoreductase subunit I
MSKTRSFLRKFLLIDIFQGLLVTLKYYFSSKVTVQYPEEVQIPPERFKGLLRLYRDEAGEPLCIACKACQRICPTGCFDIEGERREGAKRMWPTRFDWKLDRCTFCGLCVEVCPTAAIRHSDIFRLTSLSREPLLFHHPEMYLTGQELQTYICEGCLR